jgi:hypothetical protein
MSDGPQGRGYSNRDPQGCWANGAEHSMRFLARLPANPRELTRLRQSFSAAGADEFMLFFPRAVE